VLYGESVKASEAALTAHQFEVNIETAKIIEWGEATKATIAGHPYGLIGLPFLVHVWPRGRTSKRTSPRPGPTIRSSGSYRAITLNPTAACFRRRPTTPTGRGLLARPLHLHGAR